MGWIALQVSHIEVEQELVALPPVKSGTTAAPAAAGDGHPLQLLLVPSASRLGSGVSGGVVTKQMETTLCDPPKAKFGNAAVSVGGWFPICMLPFDSCSLSSQKKKGKNEKKCD